MFFVKAKTSIFTSIKSVLALIALSVSVFKYVIYILLRYYSNI